MAQENAPNKPVHVMFLCGGLIFFYLTQWTIEWLWGYFTRIPSEFVVTMASAIIALGSFTWMYRDEKIYSFADEVASEIEKVTWPTGKDVKAATIVVTIMTIISALLLGFFDMVWSKFTQLIYG